MSPHGPKASGAQTHQFLAPNDKTNLTPIALGTRKTFLWGLAFMFITPTWHLISTTPFDSDLELALIDANGVHAIPFPCRRVLGGWIRAEMKTRINVHPTHWCDWAKYS